MKLYGIYGVSGFGREVMPVARQMGFPEPLTAAEWVFVDDKPVQPLVNGHRVMTYQQFLDAEASEKYVSLAIASSSVRERLAERCISDGVRFTEVRASNAAVMDGCHIGPGAILSPFVTLTSNLKIGSHFHANIYSYVAHDCVIGDFVTFAPRVSCNGNVVIEDHAYIGTAAVLRQGTPDKPLVIGRGAIVGMGAVVTKDVPPGATVIGNPAKPMIK